jgi:hypothetical protein
MKLDSRTITLIIAALVLAALAYWFFFSGSGNQQPLTAGTQNAAQAQFETLVGELSPVSFDTALFSDVRFQSLVDISTPVAPEPIGRTDPFAAVPGVTSK